MPRRARVVRRPVLPDAKFHSQTVQRLVNKLLQRGKKSVAERIVYHSMDMIEEQTKRNPVDTLEQALHNSTPLLEVKPRRVGGATYQVPVEIRGERRLSLAVRWLLGSARARSGRSMAEKLAGEIMDAARNQGATIKRREDTHRMAEANKAFAHYRW
ncbi:MAG TPA: 30S ribosomal protein S7 [Dehalococcoidia bacterium]|nr:30S ribosomal protein S7 [Dehalococcoidia bacterium]